MSGFAKIYGSILRSSVWQQPLPTKIVWITMLALADGAGIVEASIPGLASTAGVTLEECEAALDTFLTPDKYSGSKVDGGRRIRECRGGWVIINHRFYRELKTPKQIADADRIASKRASGDMSPTDATCRNVATEAEAEAEAEAEDQISESAKAQPAKPSARKRASAMPDGWAPSRTQAILALERGVTSPATELAAFRDRVERDGSTYVNWDAAWRTWLRNAARFASKAPKQADGRKGGSVGPVRQTFEEAMAKCP